MVATDACLSLAAGQESFDSARVLRRWLRGCEGTPLLPDHQLDTLTEGYRHTALQAKCELGSSCMHVATENY